MADHTPSPCDLRARLGAAADLYIAWKHPRLQDERNIERLKEDQLGKMMLSDITSAVLVQAAERLYAGRTDATKNRNVMNAGGGPERVRAGSAEKREVLPGRLEEPQPVCPPDNRRKQRRAAQMCTSTKKNLRLINIPLNLNENSPGAVLDNPAAYGILKRRTTPILTRTSHV
jgi:hypothetical protein